MIQVWFLYFTIISLKSETTLYADRQAVYSDYETCEVAMNQSREAYKVGWKDDLHQLKMQQDIWGKNTRRQFDCVPVLVQIDSESITQVPPEGDLET